MRKTETIPYEKLLILLEERTRERDMALSEVQKLTTLNKKNLESVTAFFSNHIFTQEYCLKRFKTDNIQLFLKTVEEYVESTFGTFYPYLEVVKNSKRNVEREIRLREEKVSEDRTYLAEKMKEYYLAKEQLDKDARLLKKEKADFEVKVQEQDLKAEKMIVEESRKAALMAEEELREKNSLNKKLIDELKTYKSAIDSLDSQVRTNLRLIDTLKMENDVLKEEVASTKSELSCAKSEIEEMKKTNDVIPMIAQTSFEKISELEPVESMKDIIVRSVRDNGIETIDELIAVTPISRDGLYAQLMELTDMFELVSSNEFGTKYIKYSNKFIEKYDINVGSTKFNCMFHTKQISDYAMLLKYMEGLVQINPTIKYASVEGHDFVFKSTLTDGDGCIICCPENVDEEQLLEYVKTLLADYTEIHLMSQNQQQASRRISLLNRSIFAEKPKQHMVYSSVTFEQIIHDWKKHIIHVNAKKMKDIA